VPQKNLWKYRSLLWVTSDCSVLSRGFCLNLHNDQPITITLSVATVTFYLVMQSITADASSQSVSLSVTADSSCRSYWWTAMWWSVSRNGTETALRKTPIKGEVERRRNFVNILRFARGGKEVGVRLPRSRYVADRRDVRCPLFKYIIVRATGTVKQSFRTEIR
jgi:hypothetical protein